MNHLKELFPKKIKNCYRLGAKIDVFDPKLNVHNELEKYNQGDSAECLISYMNHFHQFILRIEGRGEEMKFKAEKLHLIYDEVGPIAGYTEDFHYLQENTLEDIVLAFKNWLDKELI